MLALAPVIWLVLQAVTTFYSLFDGRYVAFAVALGAALWGLALAVRPLAWAATGIAVVALALALVHYSEKPSGVSVLGGSAPTSVWDLSRAQVLGRFLHPGEREVVAALERQARKGDTVALAIRREDVSYPYFGKPLDRRVIFVKNQAQTMTSNWVVIAPESNVRLKCPCRPVTVAIKEIVNSHGWRLIRLEG